MFQGEKAGTALTGSPLPRFPVEFRAEVLENGSLRKPPQVHRFPRVRQEGVLPATTDLPYKAAMKLEIQDWKSAWFDAKINDRFFQEMSRVEKGMIKELGTSAHWMEQVMIEVGQLAQSMIRLEKADTPEPQIRQAMEKALRLAALSLQLVTTLDGLDRTMLKSGQRQYASPTPAQAMPPKPMEIAAGEIRSLAPVPQPVSPPPREESVSPHAALPPFLLRQMGAPPDGKTAGGQEAAPASEDAAGQAPPDGATEEITEAITEATAEAAPGENGGGTFPTLSPLLDFSPDRPEVATSRMHDTIVSLSQQGLSRAEIEAVTGEPRHIIEALIDHARGRQPGSSPLPAGR